MAEEKKIANETVTTDYLVDCFIPEDDEDQNFVAIGINGKTYAIKKGETVKVPYFVKRALLDSVEARKEARKRERDAQKTFSR